MPTIFEDNKKDLNKRQKKTFVGLDEAKEFLKKIKEKTAPNSKYFSTINRSFTAITSLTI